MDRIALTLIQALPAHQAREGLNPETVAAYTQHVVEGGDLPPVVVYKDGDGAVYLADGFHRVEAYKAAERQTIPAEVRKGTQREAFKYALGANEDHGLRRTNNDRRRAVTLALADVELGQLSDRALAKICRVSHPFVAKVRGASGKADAGGLDDVDLWEGETDPDKQLERLLSLSDLAMVEALWGNGARFATAQFSPAHNHRRALRGIAAAKLHADVAGFLEPERPAVNKAVVARSEALALYDGGATGQEAETLASPKEWAKALQFRNLSPYDRLVGLISQRVKVGSWGYVENERLLGLVSQDCAFVKAIGIKKAAAEQKRAEEREAQQTPWPWPRSVEQLDTLIDWINGAEVEQLKGLVAWYRSYQACAWLNHKDVSAALRARLDDAGVSIVSCRKAECEHGFIVADGRRCVVCDAAPAYAEENNQHHVRAVRSLLRRGLVTLVELGIEAAPIVEADEAQVEAPKVEMLPPAPIVEADEAQVEAPVDDEAQVEALPPYRVGWGEDAEPAKRLCGRLQRAVKEDLGAAFDELKAAFTAWQGARVVPSPLVRWVPAFDILGRWLEGQGFADEVVGAVRALVPALGAVTPPAVEVPVVEPPVVEGVQYRIGTDSEAWPAASLAEHLKQAFRNAEGWTFAGIEAAFNRWNVDRIVTDELAAWVPAFDMCGKWINSDVAGQSLIDALKPLLKKARLTPAAVSATDPPPPIAGADFADQDLWATAPLARQVIKFLLAWQSSGGTKGLDRATIAAGAWSAQKEAVPADMPSEILAVLEAADSGSDTKIEEALQAACFGGPITLRWINNAEEDEPVKPVAPLAPVEAVSNTKRRAAKNAAAADNAGAAAK